MAENPTVKNGTGAGTDYAPACEQLSDGSYLQSVELHSEDGAGNKTKAGTSTNPIQVAVPDKVTSQSLNCTSTSNSVEVDTNGLGQIWLTISGTWTGTLQFDFQDDAGNWHPYSPYHFGQGTDGSAGLNQVQSQTTVNGVWKGAATAGARKVRVKVASAGTGSATVVFRGGYAPYDFVAVAGILGDIPDNTADPNAVHPGGYPVYVGGESKIVSGETPETLASLHAPVSASGNRAKLGMSPWREARVTQSDKYRDGTITANAGTVVVPLEGCNAVQVRITNGGTAWSGTLQFESSIDGSQWDFAIATNTSTLDGLLVTSTTANGRYSILMHGGARFFRVRASAFTTGSGQTAVVRINASSAAPPYLLSLVSGGTAHDSPDTGGPLKTGGHASSTIPTAVSADGDRVDDWADRVGRKVVLIGSANPANPVTANGSAAGTSVIAAPGASLSLVVRKASVHNRASSAQVVSLRDGAAGTIRWTAELAADGGGSLVDFGSRGWKLTANTALVADIAAASVDVNITDYSIEP